MHPTALVVLDGLFIMAEFGLITRKIAKYFEHHSCTGPCLPTLPKAEDSEQRSRGQVFPLSLMRPCCALYLLLRLPFRGEMHCSCDLA